MSGIRFICRVSTAEIFDDFNRANTADLGGQVTPIGATVWTKYAAAETTLTGGIVSNRLRAGGGEAAVGNVAYLLDTGTYDYDVTYTVRDVRGISASPYVVFRGIDHVNHFAVSHRHDFTTPGYGIIRRLENVVRFEAQSTTVPVPGDRVRIRVRGQVVEVIVNDVSIMVFTMAGGETRTKCGVLFVAGDQITSFDNFSIYKH